jgi:hypothetical protein
MTIIEQRHKERLLCMALTSPNLRGSRKLVLMAPTQHYGAFAALVQTERECCAHMKRAKPLI